MISFLRARRFVRDDCGASLLEFALVLPVLAFMMVGLVDFGRGMAIAMALESAARSGAEYGSLFPQDTVGLQTAITDALGPGLTASSVSTVKQCRCVGVVVSDCNLACNGGGTEMYLRILVNFNYSPILPYPGIASNFPIEGSAEFRMR